MGVSILGVRTKAQRFWRHGDCRRRDGFSTRSNSPGEEFTMSRSRAERRSDFTRKEPSANEAGRLNKLAPQQAQAIKSLEFGHSAAGREFKERGSESYRPVVEQRLPMPSESTPTDLDEFGDEG
jgi:hypothetical protein